jgi:hypothetical protein
MRYLTVFFFSLLFALSSCNKGKTNFVLKGTITDATFNQHHSGASVQLYEIEAGGSSTNLIGTAEIGSDGAYSFTFPRNKVESYTLLVEKDGYFTVDENIPFSGMTISEDNERNFSTTAKSWAKIRLINSNPLPSDHLQITKQEGKNGCLECCDNTIMEFYGALDTTIYCVNDGNTTYSFYYTVVGTANQGIQSGNTVVFDTTQISLNY